MDDSTREPPRHLWYTLEQALDLLSDLEEARDALIESGQLAAALLIEGQIYHLEARLDFDNPTGGVDE